MNNIEVMSLYELSTVRGRARKVYDLGLHGDLIHFTINEDNLDKATDLVVNITKNNYPDLEVPYHSRWRHFEVVQDSIYKDINSVFESLDKHDALKKKVELVLISSLLDAGAGQEWKYEFKGEIFSRSEGLAVATLQAYLLGKLSSIQAPCGVGGAALTSISEDDFCGYFQVCDDNPLIGISNRVSMLHSIGAALLETKHDSLFDAIFPDIDLSLTVVSMHNLFQDLLMFLVPLMPESKRVNNIPIGDVGQHECLECDNNPLGLIPFHKLTQWICYSLIEPFQAAGITVTDIDSLTGLPEYRNGGLFSDLNVLTLKDSNDLGNSWALSSTFIVEWRALTVALLDMLKSRVAIALNKDISMGALLQGGTWEAGRQLAKKLRESASGPYKMDSQGTIF